MGVWNEYHVDLTIPAESIAPLATICRSMYEDGSLYGEGQPSADDHEVIAWAIFDVEGNDTHSMNKPQFTVEPDGSLVVEGYGYGKIGDAQGMEALLAKHGAKGTIEGEAEGEKYLVRIGAGKIDSYGGVTVYPDDPATEKREVWSLAVCVDGSVTTSLHLSEKECYASLRTNFDDIGEYADLPDDELIDRLERGQELVIGIDQHDL